MPLFLDMWLVIGNTLSTSATGLYLHFMMHTCMPQVNDSECNLLELSPVDGYTVRGYAVFDGPTLNGRITFVRACEYK